MGYGSKSSTYTASGLSSGHSYTFYLRNGQYSYSPLLASRTCSTKSAPAPAPTKPDYIIKDIWLGTDHYVHYTLKNVGTGNATSDSMVGVFVDGSYHGQQPIANHLTAGQSINFTYYGWKCSSGSHSIKLYADYTNDINESNESNNSRTETVSCTAPAPSPSCSGAVNLTLSPSTVSPYASFTAGVSGLSGCNGKYAYFYRWNGSKYTPINNKYCLVSGSGCSVSLTAPSSAGNYYYGASVDKNGDGDVYDSGEWDTAVLTVESGGGGGGGGGACSGNISCAGTTENSATLNYNFSNCGTVYLYRNSSYVMSLGSGPISGGTHTASGLSPSTSYTFYLKNDSGFSRSATCSTKASLNLPTCSFNDTPGVWVKDKNAGWNDTNTCGSSYCPNGITRCLLGKYCTCYGPSPAFVTVGEKCRQYVIKTKGPTFQSNGIDQYSHRTDFCKTLNASITSLPKCDFSGNPGEVYITPVSSVNRVDGGKSWTSWRADKSRWCSLATPGCKHSWGWGDSAVATYSGYRGECYYACGFWGIFGLHNCPMDCRVCVVR